MVNEIIHCDSKKENDPAVHESLALYMKFKLARV